MKASPYRQEQIEACFDPEVLAAMWAEVPEPFRLTRYRYDSVPAEYASSFGLRAATKARDTTDVVNLARLPETMAQEVAWAIWRMVVDQGRKVVSQFDTMLVRVADVVGRPPPGTGPVRSLVDLSLAQWAGEIAKAHVRRGCVVSQARQHVTAFRTLHELVSLRYDRREWWRRDVWNPSVDQRIPEGPRAQRTAPGQLSSHHPEVASGSGEMALQGVPGDRPAHLVESDGACRLSAALRRLSENRWHRRPLVGRRRQRAPRRHARLSRPSPPTAAARIPGGSTPFQWLHRPPVDRRRGVLQLDDHRTRNGGAGPGTPVSRAGYQALSVLPVRREARHASRAKIETGVAEQVIDDEALSLILEKAELIGRPVEEGGLGDPQAMNILLLLAFTGRRINEILMLDFDPLLPLGWEGGTDKDRGWFVAKLRYQQTKIRQAPDTIPVEAEVVAIIKAQQKWAQEFMVKLTGRPDQSPPRYLFVGRRQNHHGARHCPVGSISNVFTNYAAKIDARDQAGHLIDISRTHRFRHTRATTLINRGVQLPVLMRYMGHAFPSMTLHYAHIAASTEERAFIRFQKVTSDGRPLDIDPRDLYDMMQLMADADRMLPNGVCLLPPKMACDRGNACLTCPKFATDRAYYDAHVAQLSAIDELIEQRQGEFLAKHGTPMSEDNVWLAGRRQEQGALRSIIATLDAQAADDARAIRGAGAGAKAEQPIALDLDRHRRTA